MCLCISFYLLDHNGAQNICLVFAFKSASERQEAFTVTCVARAVTPKLKRSEKLAFPTVHMQIFCIFCFVETRTEWFGTNSVAGNIFILILGSNVQVLCGFAFKNLIYTCSLPATVKVLTGFSSELSSVWFVLNQHTSFVLRFSAERHAQNLMRSGEEIDSVRIQKVKYFCIKMGFYIQVRFSK